MHVEAEVRSQLGVCPLPAALLPELDDDVVDCPALLEVVGEADPVARRSTTLPWGADHQQ